MQLIRSLIKSIPIVGSAARRADGYVRIILPQQIKTGRQNVKSSFDEIGSKWSRFRFASSYLIGPFKILLLWVFKSRESANFTYDLTETSKKYLVAFVGEITNLPYQTIANYVAELENDKELKTHLTDTINYLTDGRELESVSFYGRRIGWYALVRASKPRLVVETGVAFGVGSCLLSAALLKNQEEGFPGIYRGTELNPSMGKLLAGKYATVGKILYGDSIESLKKMQEGPIDFFINDSDHSASYEEQEYITITDMLNPDAIIIGDNAHVTDKLFLFAQNTNRRFMFFREKPLNHWYPGAGIGVAFKKRESV